MYYSKHAVAEEFVVDNIEKVKLLIRVAKQVKDVADQRALLTLAEELLSKAASSAPPNPEVTYPVIVFARYKGNDYQGKLLQGWKIERDGNEFPSPSAAAVDITGNPANGWRFWHYINQRHEERPINDLRSKKRGYDGGR